MSGGKTKELKLQRNNENQLVAGDDSVEEKILVSACYGWSTHNCPCENTSKTGLILYPSDTQYKNIVLLVCELCYKYKGPAHGTQHQQLADWYFSIYGDRKSFKFTSGFSAKIDGQLGFNSKTFNKSSSCPYHTEKKTMGPLEQEAVQNVVKGKLDSYKLMHH
ncbi:unnamed protein product [Adineta steineri]|uniref:Uncharacterized protein n=1 Tax=Adineta steineri TaxID=433720 RepID=A0A819WG70_9BILA|nr:unnamed protein product [Adineta steineri]CAF4072512.1 unnamed protein product [Adineta steineri]CAF4121880.1 unnamed protein product [Adineta steineri]